ncbi:MAG: ABC transporter substrate-binding protein [Proteobacteria bacterium]|nr:ABC transporter substrate-binding protein [Pseudomonadota bacterium]MCG6936277.1 ABC transporter substrate-binding protein [Pseudomonadota bacterium]
MTLIHRQWAWLLLAGLLSPLAVAADLGPQQLVEQTSNEILTRLRQDRPALEKDPAKINALLEDIVLPHFDFVRISAWTLGKYWRTASQAQKLRFIQAFRTLLVRTYGVALLNYTDNKISYLPLRDDPASVDVTVRTEVLGKGRYPVAVNYRLYKLQGEWKVYDVSIDGISLVANFRASYAGEIKQDGLDALISRIEQHNANPPAPR